MFSIPFLKSQSYLGVDIGTTSIKIVEIKKGRKRPKLLSYGVLESYGHLERLNNAIQTSSLKIMEKEAAELLKMILKSLKTNSNEVIASVPVFSAFITLMEIPQMSEAETAKAIPFQLQQYIPLPASEVSIEWLKVGEREEGGIAKQQMLLIAVSNEIIKRYQNIFKLAGLRLKYLEIESLSLIRAVVNDSKTTLIIDIGGRLTNIAVASQGVLKYNSYTDFSGGSLTQTIASGLGINIRRAEGLKKQRGLLDTNPDSELSTLIFPFLDAIISEAKRVREAFEKNQGTMIEKVILAGGGAKLLGIEKYFHEQLNLETTIARPFAKLDYPAKIEPLINDLGPAFSVAIGLGIREFI